MVIQGKTGRQIKDYDASEYQWEGEVLHKPRTSRTVNWDNCGNHIRVWTEEI